MHIQKHRRNEFVGLMKELIRLFHPHTYVEIGVAEGYTFNQLVEMPQLKRMVAVDINPMPNIRETDRVQKFVMSSFAFSKIWKEPIDLLFIDGDHNCGQVLNDFVRVGRFVRNGTGMILLHDTHPVTEELLQPQFCDDAWKAVEEIRYGNFSCDVFTFPGPWAGATLIRKRTPHHLCWKGG